MQAIKSEIEKKRPMLFVIDENGQWLLQNLYVTDKTGRRKSTASEVQQRLAEITNLVHQLNEELNSRRSRINAILADALTFEDSAAQFDKWLTPVEKTLDSQKPVSINPDELKNQALKHEVINFKTSVRCVRLI